MSTLHKCCISFINLYLFSSGTQTKQPFLQTSNVHVLLKSVCASKTGGLFSVYSPTIGLMGWIRRVCLFPTNLPGSGIV